MELSEHIREEIRKLVAKAKGMIDLPEPIEDMLVQICYEMYKKGLTDGHRFCINACEISKKNLKM